MFSIKAKGRLIHNKELCFFSLDDFHNRGVEGEVAISYRI